ncbi:NRDE family protein [Plantibacter flavus]|uniref:NRDE family protein n=1 Tax=Plantibacter flavus TaxID=150123 RepID=UPI003F159BD2
MCTVIIDFDPERRWPIMMLGLRDEQPGRAWDPPGAWWPQLGESVHGIHDREAGGAWLASNDDAPGGARAAVVLNRREDLDVPEGGWTSRGVLPLEAVTTGVDEQRARTARSWNLVELAADRVRVTSWDGESIRSIDVPPGLHLVTHEGPDHLEVPRVHRWRPAFVTAAAPTGPLDGETAASWEPWLRVLRDSTVLPTGADEAIVRVDEHDGLRLASLSVTALALAQNGAVLRNARLEEPGHLPATLRWE